MGKASKQAPITKDSGVLILLLGRTGVGKSTFINAAAGQPIASVNHDLTSPKLDVRGFTIQHPKHSTRSFVFVDTPGFDHISATDGEILKVIVDWLKKSCHSDVPFGGIVYLHDISASRMSQATVDVGIMALGGLTRPQPASRLLMTTVKWGKVQKDPHAESREQELRNSKWKRILDGGAQIQRFADTEDSAWNIVDNLLREEPLELEVLREDLERVHRFFATSAPIKIRFKRGFFADFFKRMGFK